MQKSLILKKLVFRIVCLHQICGDCAINPHQYIDCIFNPLPFYQKYTVIVSLIHQFIMGYTFNEIYQAHILSVTLAALHQTDPSKSK